MLRFFHVPLCLVLSCAAMLSAAAQQSPIALPNTFSTAGGGGAALVPGAACSPGSALSATDALGDGCPAPVAQFSSDLRGGVATDPLGNIYVADTSNSAVRVINAQSGVVTLFAGKGTTCSTKTDSNGDNCPRADTAFSSTPRGIASDPYGNIFIAGYGSHLVNLVCNAVSPLCPATAGEHQIGSMYLVAGCVASPGSAGTATATAGAVANGGTATPTGVCSATVSELNQPRGVAADRFGNVYIADTGDSLYRVVAGPASFNGVANPLATLIAMNPAYSAVTAATAAGNIYPLLGATSPAANAPCSSGSSASSLDAYGDGCPYSDASLNSPSSSAVQGIAIDPSGNILITDLSTKLLRVIYMGGAKMSAVITANNPSVASPALGSIYAIAGGGSSAPSLTPSLGNAVSLDTSAFKVTTDFAGNIYIGDNTSVLFLDGNTGYIRKLASTGSVCSSATDAIGDGCSAAQASFGGSNGLGVALDGNGDLFLADTNNARIREVAATALLPTAVHASSTQTIVLHGAPGTSSIASALTNATAGSTISLGAPACGSAAGDGTLDCQVPVTFAPPSPGLHSVTLAATPSGSGTAPATFALRGIADGAGLVFDGATPTVSVLGGSLSPAGLATDGNGNTFTYDSATATLVEVSAGGTVTHLPGALKKAPSQIALDAAANVYAVGGGSDSITKLTLGSNGAYTAGTLSFAPNGAAATPQAIAVDSNGDFFVYDSTSKAIYRLSQSSIGPVTALVASGYDNVTALALAPSGNLFVADPGAQSIYSVTSAGVQTTVAAGISAVALGVDAAGDLYAADSLSQSLVEYPISGPRTTVDSSLGSAPTGVAVDPSGNVFAVDAAQSGVLLIARSAAAIDFGTDTTAVQSGSLTNIGNTSAEGLAQTDSADFQLAAGAANGCNISATSFAPGSACTVAASFTPGSGTGNVTDAVTFLPAATSSGSLSLAGVKNGLAVTTATALGTEAPQTPTYTADGLTEVSFTVTVTASTGTASGSVAVTVDAASPVSYPLDASGRATVSLSGLTAGSHSISATYPSQNGLAGSSTAGATMFSIAQAPVVVAWAPSVRTQAFSSALGLGVLNATATLPGAGLAAPGNFVYTATLSGGTAIPVDASAYLPIGTYSLSATFVPADSVDYAGGTAAVSAYTVTKAGTTAAVGGTQNLVAADGTGNFSSVQAALNALPAAGGSIYLKPGTYNGFVTVIEPNVAIRGLGGDPTQVILTNEDGAFSPPYLAGQGPGNNAATGDQGSATLVVAKGALNGITATPNNFYMEGLTVANTYDTDTGNADTVGSFPGANGTAACQTLPAPMNNMALYDGAGTAASPGLCNSQALALWITGDQAVLNNIHLNSLQDTLYAGSQGCGATCTVSRQYYWQSKITGDVDYIFGDAAAAFDHTSIYTLFHGKSATGTTTVEAQNKKFATGSAGDYLSGYVFNHSAFTSQAPGMTQLFFGRPYGQYSTNILLNTYVDQVNPLGYFEFSASTDNLPTSTYAEFNTVPYTDPATGSPDVNGIVYTGAGGSTGTGVSGPRETVSLPPTTFNAAQAAPYFPVNFLGSPVTAASLSTGESATWDPAAALAADENAFVPSATTTNIGTGSRITILMRPQTPGAGAIPTGSWQLSDSGNLIASGQLDASGQAYYTSSTLSAGTHSFTWTYSGDSNFSGSATATPYIVNVGGTGASPVISIQPSAMNVYGNTATVTVTVSATSGTTAPGGQVSFAVDSGAPQSGTLSATGASTFSVPSLSAGTHSVSVTYAGNGSFSAASASSSFNVAKQILQVAANNITLSAGQTAAAYSATITGFVNGDTQASAVTGAPSLTTSPASPSTPGIYPILATTGTLSSANYTFAFTNGTLEIQSASQAAPVATGDTRTVTEPRFPLVCTALTASLTSVNGDIPTTVDATVTNPDGARIQAALNSCANSNQAVELSVDNAGHDSFLSGPLNMPSGVTLLVDPGVTVFFSRNVQDYDLVAGTHTCGTVNSNSATSSCLPLINIANVSNVSIMGFGKLDGRGGDTLLNAFPASYAGQSWWGLSAIANSGGSQQNPRFVQMSNATNVTLYKITLRNSPLFHVSTTGGEGVNGFTAWDAKIITPTSARNTDGIDPGNAQNVTITRSWVSDGDDNIAVGASGSTTVHTSENISVIGNHFFAGHGESIGSITDAGVSNVLFDDNMLAGNESVDSNSTGIRIKSANSSGGLVQNIQYSNSCFENHKTEIQFTPVYSTTPGTLTPNFQNILLQNLTFLTEGTVQFTGANNNGVVNPLIARLDNVSFSTLSASDFSVAPTNAELTLGPGQVSSNFVAAYQSFVGSNGNTLADDRTATALVPPMCSFTAIAPELTGPAGLPQTITFGQEATAVVILTPAVAGNAYPTGTVTLADDSGDSATVALTGAGDTLSIPLPNLSVSTHTFTATYSGDANYVPATAGTPYSTTEPYLITVEPGSLLSTTTTLTGVPSTASFGNAVTVTAMVAGSSPTGLVQFVVNGSVSATASVSANGSAQTSLSLPLGSYTLTAIYNGDGRNAGSSSTVTALTVSPAVTSTTLATTATTTTLGTPVTLTATVSSVAGTPTGTVTFAYTTGSSTTAVPLISATLTGGVASASANLPIGSDNVTATYVAAGSFAMSSSTPPVTVVVNPPVIAPLPAAPIALPYAISTLAGGAASATANTACSGSLDKYGDGCQATAISLTGSSLDLRSVVADPFGNVYFTDANASLVRRVSPDGIISNYAGYVSGAACVPTATAGCTPTLVKLNKPRGIFADSQGNLYIAGYSDNKVYKVSVSTGLLSLVAGSGTKPSDPTAANGDGGPAASAMLNGPRGVWSDTVGNTYIADTSDNKIRVVDASGNIQTVAGTGVSSSTGNGGVATAATVSNPQGVLTDSGENIYIADSSSVRVICVTCTASSPLSKLLNKLGVASPQNGDIYLLAGGGTAPYAGPALANTITMSPQKLAIDASGDLYISDGNGVIWFVDSRTAFIRSIAGGTTTTCNPTASPNIGDGCPATQAIIGDGGNGIGVGTDNLGNLYIADTLNARIRKVSTGLQFAAAATGTTASQPVEIHYIAGDSPATAHPFVLTGSEWKLGAPACTTNSDTTTDCLVAASFTPAVPGLRSAPLAVNSAAGNTANLALTGTGIGAGATLDPGSQTSFGTGLQVAGVAVDPAGNVYVSDTSSKHLLRFAVAALPQGASAAATVLATLGAPGPVAIDARGFAYVADTSDGKITQVSPSGVASVLPFQFSTPSGIAVDALDNLYVADSSAQAVYQLSPFTGAQRKLALGTLAAPAGLAVDPAGNLLVADPGAAAIYRFNLDSGARTTISSPATKPTALAADAAGNLLVADAASILAVPASSNSAPFTIASIPPSSLALDAAGNLYTGSGGAVLKLTRTQAAASFKAGMPAAQTVSLLSSGNQPLTLSSLTQTDGADFTLTAAASTDCTLNGGLPSALVVGGACTLTANATANAAGGATDTVTLNGNEANAALSTPSLVQLVLSIAQPPAKPQPTGSTVALFDVFNPSVGVQVTTTITGPFGDPVPSGQITLFQGGRRLGNLTLNSQGVAGVDGYGYPTGPFTLTIQYLGDSFYAPAAIDAVTYELKIGPFILALPPSLLNYGASPDQSQVNAAMAPLE